MRKVLISLAVAASALTAAAPAAAQYYPAPPPYGQAYGYNNDSQRRMDAFMWRIDQFRQDIRQQDRQGRLSSSDAARLDRALMEIRRDVLNSARNGVSSRENQRFDNRLDRLRAQMRAEMRDGRREYRNDDYRDRDRDGRNDRYEDDRGRQRDR